MSQVCDHRADMPCDISVLIYLKVILRSVDLYNCKLKLFNKECICVFWYRLHFSIVLISVSVKTDFSTGIRFYVCV